MGKESKVLISKRRQIGEISENLFGSFLEHLGRAIYTGIYEPEHATADADGFRTDVADLVRELEVPLVRYPGGNFVSGYCWKDGIGDHAKRPRKLELAWRTIETNQVGIDEFAKWADKVGCGVMPAVNLGTGTPQDAADLVEYCNFPGGTQWSDKRRENGREKPYDFKYWCIGNEADGDWQICHMTADEYGRKAHETIKMMKWVDPTIKVTVAGSSGTAMPTYPEWDRIVLEHTYDEADYLSLHQYYAYRDGIDKKEDYLHSYLDLDSFINTVVATADYVKAYKRSSKTMMLSLDEWNVWHQHMPDPENTDWAIAPSRIENVYDVKDALLFGGMMMTIINHADRIKIGCMAQLVNAIAPILTQKDGAVVKQTIFYPYKAGCLYAKGKALKTEVDSDKVSTIYGDADLLYSASAYDEETGELTVFLLNTGEEELSTNIKLEGFANLMLKEHQEFTGDLEEKNTFDNPNNVVMSSKEMQEAYEPGNKVTLSGYSFHVLRYVEN